VGLVHENQDALRFRVDIWDDSGDSIVEHVAGVEDYQVALATYRAACERWPGTPITLTAAACAWCRRVQLRARCLAPYLRMPES
jgi:hypothetical protein